MDQNSSLDAAPSYTAEFSCPVPNFQTLQLLHVNRKQRTFSFPPETSSFHYSIQVNDSSGLIKKPDLIIARDSGTLEKIGEGRFEKYGPGTAIKYFESGQTHDLQLESSLSQRFMITHDGNPLWWWQPSQRDTKVAEVVTAGNEFMAQFTYSAGGHSLVGRDVKDDTVLGVLEVGGRYACQPAVLDQIVSMTAVLVERAKRRGRNQRGYEGTSPITSLAMGGPGGSMAL